MASIEASLAHKIGTRCAKLECCLFPSVTTITSCNCRGEGEAFGGYALTLILETCHPSWKKSVYMIDGFCALPVVLASCLSGGDLMSNFKLNFSSVDNTTRG